MYAAAVGSFLGPVVGINLRGMVVQSRLLMKYRHGSANWFSTFFGYLGLLRWGNQGNKGYPIFTQRLQQLSRLVAASPLGSEERGWATRKFLPHMRDWSFQTGPYIAWSSVILGAVTPVVSGVFGINFVSPEIEKDDVKRYLIYFISALVSGGSALINHQMGIHYAGKYFTRTGFYGPYFLIPWLNQLVGFALYNLLGGRFLGARR